MSAFTSPPEDGQVGEVAAPERSAPVTAAVLVPLRGHQGATQMILTRRRADLRRHAGEISFPGGRCDPHDADLAETALREAEEEIGLARDRVTLIGRLAVTSTFVTGYEIHPFVGSIAAGADWLLSEAEVDAVLELSLEEIRAGQTLTTLTRRGFTFQTNAYVVGENLIWGATARIIEQLLERLVEQPDGSLELRQAASAA